MGTRALLVTVYGIIVGIYAVFAVWYYRAMKRLDDDHKNKNGHNRRTHDNDE